MKINNLLTALGIAVGLTMAASAYATPITGYNLDRPVVIGANPSEPTMQSILDQVYGTGQVSAANDQQTAGEWGSSSSLYPTVTPILSFEYAGNKNGNSLGIWSGADTSSISLDTIFNGQANAGTRATIAWLTETTGMVYQIGGNAGDVNAGAFSGISWKNFGFFLNGPGTTVNGVSQNVYTIDALNADGQAHSLAYHGAGGNATNWVIGFDDSYGSADKDFQDMVIRVESVNPVPEPSTLFLLGAGLLAFGAFSRRRGSFRL
jgi:hypothetical protein